MPFDHPDWYTSSMFESAACFAAQMQHQRALLQNAGPYNEDSLVGVPDEVNTGEQYGSDEKVNVCKFPLGSVNNWNVRRSPMSAGFVSLSVSASPMVLGIPDVLPLVASSLPSPPFKGLDQMHCTGALVCSVAVGSKGSTVCRCSCLWQVPEGAQAG